MDEFGHDFLVDENKLPKMCDTKKAYSFVEDMIHLLGTLFTQPEHKIVEQGEESDCMYFIIAGECLVILEDSTNFERIKTNLLGASDFFGELGCLFKCKRTCSIMSASYNIVARLTKPRLRNIISDYP